MPTFSYIARDHEGNSQNGRLVAVDESDAVAILQHRGLMVTSIQLKDVEMAPQIRKKALNTRRMHRRVKTDDHVLLCQQLATLVGAGVPLLRSLHVVSSQVESTVLLQALEMVIKDVESGSTFRSALAKHPNVFSNLWLNLVETGEASGHLSESLNQLAKHFESAQHLRNEAQTAMTYPAVLILAAVAVIVFFVYWLIPRFTSTFTSSGMNFQLPLITKIVIGTSEFARRFVFLIVGAVVAVGYFARQYLKTEDGQWTKDRLILQVPVICDVFRYIYLAEFSRGMCTLLESGVPLLSSLKILEESSSNRLYAQAIGHVKEAVREGKPMAEMLEEEGIFPPMLVQMVQVGEEVGELPAMAGRTAKYYEERVEIFVARMTRLFEPIAIMVLGLVVLVIVLAIFLPIFNLASSVKV